MSYGCSAFPFLSLVRLTVDSDVESLSVYLFKYILMEGIIRTKLPLLLLFIWGCPAYQYIYIYMYIFFLLILISRFHFFSRRWLLLPFFIINCYRC